MTEFARETASDALDDRRRSRSGSDWTVGETVLNCLRRADGPLRIAEVADRIVDEDVERRHERVQHVYLALARRHVPALEDRGIVEYDRTSGELELAGPHSA